MFARVGQMLLVAGLRQSDAALILSLASKAAVLNHLHVRLLKYQAENLRMPEIHSASIIMRDALTYSCIAFGLNRGSCI